MTETTFGMVTGPNSICKNLIMFQKSYLISWGVRRMNCLSCCSLATFSIISMLIRLFTMSWMSENEYYLFRKKPAFYYTTCLIASSKLIGRSFPNIYSIWQLWPLCSLSKMALMEKFTEENDLNLFYKSNTQNK